MDMGRRNWRTFPRSSSEFENGLDKYMENAFAVEVEGDEIRCPCKNCCYRYWFDKDVVRDHVIMKGFVPLLERNIDSRVNSEARVNDENLDHGSYLNDDMDGLLHDISREGPNEDPKKFFKLVEDGQQELYPECKNFSKMSFILRLFVFKHNNKLSNYAFADLLELLRATQPDAKLPSSFNEAKNTLGALGLDYVKIDACPNDCMLFWGEHGDATHCHTCKASRWKSDKKEKEDSHRHKISAKVLRYFPVKERLQRLYMCTKTTTHMTWHERSRQKDSYLRHPVDGEDWKIFDISFSVFAEDPRNVRLALSTDGFNPYNMMGIKHSTWPVVLINYNLPSWLCMKPEFIKLRLHGRCVTKQSMKEKGKEKIQSYNVLPEFLESIKADLVQQLTPSLPLPFEFLQGLKSEVLNEVTPDLTSMIVSIIQAGNPGVQLNLPNFNLTPGDASSAKSCQQNGEPSAHNLSSSGQER